MDINRIAKTIETDAGEPLPGLRQALKEARARKGRATTPEQLRAHLAGAGAPVKRKVSPATEASLKKIKTRFGKALDNLGKR